MSNRSVRLALVKSVAKTFPSVSRWMRYVDDVEFWFDPVNMVIQVRSASRLGKGDLGVNRARIESLRATLNGKSVAAELVQARTGGPAAAERPRAETVAGLAAAA